MDIHKNQIELYGGELGVRDIRLLESAISQPQASFGDAWLHKDLFEMASAYAYHICQNHPFIDGNKRVGLASALIFLDMNGVSVNDPKGLLFDTMLDVAKSKITKTQLSDVLRHLPNERPI